MNTISVTKIFEFEAAHRLPHHKGKCCNLHGHTYKLEVEVAARVVDFYAFNDPREMGGKVTGMVMDFGDLKKIVKEEVIDKLDHKMLNDLGGICGIFEDYPTAENICLWIESRIKARGIFPCRIRLWETSTSYAEWKE